MSSDSQLALQNVILDFGISVSVRKSLHLSPFACARFSMCSSRVTKYPKVLLPIGAPFVTLRSRKSMLGIISIYMRKVHSKDSAHATLLIEKVEAGESCS